MSGWLAPQPPAEFQSTRNNSRPTVNLLKTLFANFREDFGHPARLARLLEEHPEIRVSLTVPPPSIAAETVVQWDDLADAHYRFGTLHKPGTLMGWKLDAFSKFSSFKLERPEYARLIHCEVTEGWECDIADVDGFSNSKSRLKDFATTDAMVEANSTEMIASITREKLAENLAHKEIRIIHSPGVDWFCRSLWDGRLFLMNSGGSHHFAAAKYIAARLSEPVALRGRLKTYSLNATAIAAIRRDYELFAISDDSTISNAFHAAMEAVKATWLWHPLPRPFDDAKAILLPKAEARSMRVAALLKQAGVIDLGQHLAFLAAHQSQN
jgi:hypothetical protein